MIKRKPVFCFTERNPPQTAHRCFTGVLQSLIAAVRSRSRSRGSWGSPGMSPHRTAPHPAPRPAPPRRLLSAGQNKLLPGHRHWLPTTGQQGLPSSRRLPSRPPPLYCPSPVLVVSVLTAVRALCAVVFCNSESSDERRYISSNRIYGVIKRIICGNPTMTKQW